METKGFWEWLKDWIEEKNNSSVYIVFILSFISWNWKFFFALFFTEQNINTQTRIDYALSVGHTLSDYIITTPYVIINDVLLLLCNFIIHFFGPILITYFVVWHLPRINNFAHRKSLMFYFKRKSEFDSQYSTYQKDKTEELKIQTKEVDQQISTLEDLEKKSQKKNQIKERINKVVSDEEKWDMEFMKYKQSPSYQYLNDIKNIIYNYSGLTRKWDNKSGYILRIGSDILALADSMGLITISGKEQEEKIQWTNKGRFFIAKSIAEK